MAWLNRDKLVVIFWRIFLPLSVLAAVGVALLIYHNEERKTQEKERAAAALRQKISEARANTTSEEKEWHVTYALESATGKKVVRSAYINSNDGLCYLTVQKRLDGAQLTGLDCLDFKISEWDDIEVKFDNVATSDKLDLKSYSDSDDVYIPSYQADYSGYLSYEKFIGRLKAGKAVAIKIPAADDVWMTFSLKGSTKALNRLGKEQVNPDPTSN